MRGDGEKRRGEMGRRGAGRWGEEVRGEGEMGTRGEGRWGEEVRGEGQKRCGERGRRGAGMCERDTVGRGYQYVGHTMQATETGYKEKASIEARAVRLPTLKNRVV